MNSRIYIILIIVVTLIGCKSSSQRVTLDETSYDYESSPLHPKVLFYNSSADSTRLYVQLDAAELLYTRESPESPFTSTVKIDIVLPDLRDTLSFTKSILAETDARKIIFSYDFGFIQQPTTPCIVVISDRNRNWEERINLSLTKLAIPHRNDYLVSYVGKKTPVFSDDIATGNTIEIQSNRFPNKTFINFWVPDINLPPPPYSEAKISIPSENDSPARFTESNESHISEGIYSVYSDTTFVFSIFGRGSAYPNVKTISSMVNSLRYISSRKEYERIQQSNYPKVGLDEFWLDCGGSKDKARQLIKNYYRRVEEANRNFSSYAEGWKTDRGLVHVVFGNPNKIKKSVNDETWIYGEENNVSSVSFTFTQISSPHTDNEYRLVRNPLYRSYWDRAVTAWRNGRVFLD